MYEITYVRRWMVCIVD